MKTTRIATFVAGLALAFSAHAVEEGFTSLFNGKDLQGWEGNPAIWSVKEGAITGTTTANLGLKHNTFLVRQGDVLEDFELRLKYRIVGGNSGIQYRSKVAEQGAMGPIVGGYQADFEAGKTYSGILYEERGRGILAQRGQKVVIRSTPDGKHKIDVTGSVGDSAEIQAAIRNEDWNDYVIVARGNHLTHSINGKTTVDVTDEDAAHAAKSGVLALQVHVGPPMVVQFKEVRIKKLGGTGASAQAADLDKLQGEWVAVAGKREGEAIPEDWISSVRLKIKGEKYEVAWTDGGDAGSFKLKPGVTPHHMDVNADSSGALEAIYEFRGNDVVIAYGTDGASRPKNFSAEPGSSSLVITYRKK